MSASACIISALNSIYREISARGLCILIIPTSGTQSRHGEELKKPRNSVAVAKTGSAFLFPFITCCPWQGQI